MILPTWLYHKTLEAKVFTTEESAKEALKSGWADSPAQFEGQHENLGSQTPTVDDKKQDAQTPEQTPSEDKSGEAADKPITKQNFIKMTIAELKAYLISQGVSEDAVKKIKQKDQLIAKIGELGK